MINILWILATLIASGTSFLFFYTRAEGTDAALVAWVFGLIPALSVAVFLQSIRVSGVLYGRYLKPMRVLPGQQPRDGERVALAGRIEPVRPEEVLRTPFTQQPSVAYFYTVGNFGTQIDITPLAFGRANLQRIGFALTPSVVRASGIDGRLLAMPFLQGFWPFRFALFPGKRSPVLQNANEYFRQTPAEEVGILDFRAPIRAVFESITRDDGWFRKDFHLGGFRVLPKPITYAEWFVRPGEQVTLVGTWSSAKGGVVPGRLADHPVLYRGHRFAQVWETGRTLIRILLAFLFLVIAHVFAFVLTMGA